MKKSIAGLALLTSLAAPASAATIEAKECADHSRGCYIITINGEIGKDDGKKFQDLVEAKDVTNGMVALNSPGGELFGSLKIAYAVHEKKFTTWVGDDWHCASLCAVIWMAGSTRYYGNKAKIGFHGVYDVYVDKAGQMVKGTKPVPSSSGNALVGAFYAELGLSDKAIYTLTDAPPTSMYWLNAKTAADLQFAVERWKDPPKTPTVPCIAGDCSGAPTHAVGVTLRSSSTHNGDTHVEEGTTRRSRRHRHDRVGLGTDDGRRRLGSCAAHAQARVRGDQCDTAQSGQGPRERDQHQGQRHGQLE
jgi:hypothetical protein